MKNIKLILLASVLCLSLASCGMNNTAKNAAPTPKGGNNVSDTNNGKVEEDNKTKTNNTANDMTDKAGDAAKDVGDAAGNVAREAGDTVGDVADGAGDMAKDAIDGAGDAVGMNDANNNGQ